MNSVPSASAEDLSDLFIGNSEMADQMRAWDWSATAIGPPASWPPSLRSMVRILLTSRYQMWIGWGKDLAFFYNAAYRPTLGVKADWALGSRSDQVWAEIWSEIGPRIETVLRSGSATWAESLQLFLERSGYAEETYHTFSYSPLRDDSSTIAGMLCVVTEETERVIGERRLGTLRHLAAEVGVGQIVYGTDVPFNWPVTVDLVLDAPFLSDADKETILGANLMKLLRIGP